MSRKCYIPPAAMNLQPNWAEVELWNASGACKPMYFSTSRKDDDNCKWSGLSCISMHLLARHGRRQMNGCLLWLTLSSSCFFFLSEPEKTTLVKVVTPCKSQTVFSFNTSTQLFIHLEHDLPADSLLKWKVRCINTFASTLNIFYCDDWLSTLAVYDNWLDSQLKLF